MRLQGEMQLFLDALGARADDERLQPVLDLPGDTTDTAESRGPEYAHIMATRAASDIP